MATFRCSLQVLKIYSARYVYYRFSATAVNIGTQPVYRRLQIWIDVIRFECHVKLNWNEV